MNFNLKLENKLNNHKNNSISRNQNIQTEILRNDTQNNNMSRSIHKFSNKSHNVNKNKNAFNNNSFSRNNNNLNSINSKNKIFNTVTGNLDNIGNIENVKDMENHDINDINNSKFDNSKTDMLQEIYSKSIMSRNTDRMKLKNHSTSFSCKNKDIAFKNELTRLHTEFDDHLKLLETSIKNIQNDGFDKYKGAIQEKTNIKCEYEERIEKLKKSLNYANSIKKKIGTKNTIYEQSTKLFHKQQKVR